MTPFQLNAHYSSMVVAGLTHYQNGTVRPHPGISTDWKKRLALVATFDKRSTDRIGSYASSLTMESLLKRIVADVDFPAHTTILEAEDQSGAEIVPEKLPGKFAALEHMATKCLIGVDLEFNRMIDDGKGTIILASTRVPEFLKSARMVAEAVYRSLPPLLSKPIDIVHITAARVTDPRISTKMRSAMKSVHDSVIQIDTRLHEDPIVARIDKVRLVQVYDFLTTGPTTVPRPPKN